VKLLVEAGADVNHQSYTNSTPLHIAYKAGAFSIALYLLLHGSNDFVLNNSSHRPSELDQQLHRRVLAKMHSVRRSHKVAMMKISQIARDHENRIARKLLGITRLKADDNNPITTNPSKSFGDVHHLLANRDAETEALSGGMSKSSLENLDLNVNKPLHRIILCPRGRIMFHFFVDGRPIIMSHIPTANCTRRSYNNRANYLVVANTCVVPQPMHSSEVAAKKAQRQAKLAKLAAAQEQHENAKRNAAIASAIEEVCVENAHTPQSRSSTSNHTSQPHSPRHSSPRGVHTFTQSGSAYSSRKTTPSGSPRHDVLKRHDKSPFKVTSVHTESATILETWMQNLLHEAHLKSVESKGKQVEGPVTEQKIEEKKWLASSGRLIAALEVHMASNYAAKMRQAEEATEKANATRQKQLQRTGTQRSQRSLTRNDAGQSRYYIIASRLQEPIFVAHVERVGDMQHHANTKAVFFKTYFEPTEADSCMQVAQLGYNSLKASKAVLTSSSSSHKSNSGNTFKASTSGPRFKRGAMGDFSEIVSAAHKSRTTTVDIMPTQMNARLYALAARILYLSKCTIRQTLQKAHKHYVPPKFDIAGRLQTTTSRQALQEARDAHYSATQGLPNDPHDGKFIREWMKQINIEVEMLTFRIFVRQLAKQLLRAQAKERAQRIAKEKRKKAQRHHRCRGQLPSVRESETEEEADNSLDESSLGAGYHLPQLNSTYADANVVLTGNARMYALRLQIHKPPILRIELRENILALKVSILYD
jgi:hypothetical protein